MDHGAVIRRHRRVLLVATSLAALVALPGAAAAAEAAAPATPSRHGATLVQPVDGHHFDHLEVAPMVQFDPSTDSAGVRETPRWVLLATDRAMTATVRYCRQFVWASHEGAFHWGCNRWATGVDEAGRDRLQPLESGKVYYWQVVSASNVQGGADIVSPVRAFSVDAEPKRQSIGELSDQVHGTAFDDGTQLNLGAAAYVNSGVRVKRIHSTKLKAFAFRIHVQHLGSIDPTRSYVQVKSAAGTRYLRMRAGADGKAWALWRLTPAERRLRTKRFTYQAYLKSPKNGSLVRSPHRVVLIRGAKPRTAPPAWTPDR